MTNSISNPLPKKETNYTFSAPVPHPKETKESSYDLISKEIEEKDLSAIYEKLKHTTSISDADLNLEGALFHNEKWYFFQRGNGAQSKNGIFILRQRRK